MTWRCAWCGREHAENDPPCETCGHETFERAGDGDPSPFAGGSYVWVCPNCGREHVKNASLCARCNHPGLEQREVGDQDFSEELSVPGYLSVGWPYALGAVVVLVVVALALAGVIPVPGLGGPPTPPDAPGEATTAAGLELETVETEVRGRFAAERGSERARDEGLDALAEFLVRHEVATRYDPDYDGEVPDLRAFDPDCGSEIAGDVAELPLDPADFEDETALADAIASALLDDPAVEEAVTGDAGSEAIAVHVTPDDTVVVGYLAC